MNDLVWSAQPRMAGANAAKLARIIPELLRQLQLGLASIDYPSGPTQRFLDHLAAAHFDAVKGSDPLLQPDMLEPAPVETPVADAWLAPSEAQHSDFMETHHALQPGPVFQETQELSGATEGDEDDLAGAVPDAGLQPGAWVEMQLGGTWGRYQVTWGSPHGILFMFANAAGKSHSMTRRLLNRMLRAGALRLISGQAVVDGALDAVAQTALSNSLDLKL